MLYFLTLLPVVCFLFAMLWLDSFSLIRVRALVALFLWGAVTVCLLTFGATYVERVMPIHPVAIVVCEEFVKALGVLSLIRTRRSAFFIDAVIYGATSGAGFAFLENILYVWSYPDMSMGTAVMRGFGTAIMHCGCVAGTAAILNRVASRGGSPIGWYLAAILPAIVIHLTYNWLTLSPVLSLSLIVGGVTGWMVLLFVYNERSISRWLEMELAQEVELLAAMRRGEFSQSRSGAYLLSVRNRFSPEQFLDIYCYVQLYYELSIAAKTNLMLAESGFPTLNGGELKEKINEFHTLHKRIGKSARQVLSPLVNMNRLNGWKITSLL